MRQRLSLSLLTAAGLAAGFAAGDAAARPQQQPDPYYDQPNGAYSALRDDDQYGRGDRDPYRRDQEAAQRDRDDYDQRERDDYARRDQDPGYAPDAPPPAAVESVTVTAPYDPWERSNRRMYGVNNALDRVIIRPVAMTYRRWLPRPIRTGVRNGIDNLGEPMVFMNDTLQGHFVPAGRTATRFVINSTVGVAGLFDVATKAGVPAHDNDFGLTMGRYHVPEGPYVFLPVLGPTTVRDGFGRLIDIVASPLSYIGVPSGARVGMGAARGADTRAELDPQLKALNAGATDPYSTIRSLYLQNRKSKIQGQAAAVQELPDFGDEPAADDQAPATAQEVSAADDQPAVAPAPAPASYKHKVRTRN